MLTNMSYKLIKVTPSMGCLDDIHIEFLVFAAIKICMILAYLIGKLKCL